MSDNPVHNLKPGALGLVAHTMKSHELNGWVKTDVTIKVLPTTLVVDGEFYGLNVHIPHATNVVGNTLIVTSVLTHPFNSCDIMV
jgi:hypothetical protein